MDLERVDLSALGPSLDPLGHERLVRRVMEAAGPELVRRAAERRALALLGGWARPLMAAAAVVGVLAGGVLAATDRAETAPPMSVVDALGVPAPAAAWLDEGRGPTQADLVLAMERIP
jgi:hypothetical protein